MEALKWIRIAGIITILAAVGSYLFFHDRSNVEEIIKEVMPSASQIRMINSEPLVFEGKNHEDVIGYVVVEKGSGYQSNIKVMTGIDIKGIITGIYVLEQQETPAFFRQLEDNNFFDQFLGLQIQKGFSEENIDVIGGATISSQGAIKAINTGTNYVGRNFLQLPMEKLPINFSFGIKEIIIMVLMALAVYVTYFHINIRKISLLLSIFLLGFWYNVFITNAAWAAMLTMSLPNFYANVWWYILIAGALLLILFTGRNLFCFWICPFGSFQELLSKMGGMSYQPNKSLTNIGKYSSGFFLWLSLVLAFVSGNPNAASYEPFAALFSQTGTYLQWILLLVVILTSLFVFRFWCNYFCPVGYVLNVWVKLRRKGAALWKKRNQKIQETVSS